MPLMCTVTVGKKYLKICSLLFLQSMFIVNLVPLYWSGSWSTNILVCVLWWYTVFVKYLMKCWLLCLYRVELQCTGRGAYITIQKLLNSMSIPKTTNILTIEGYSNRHPTDVARPVLLYLFWRRTNSVEIIFLLF